MQLYIYVAEFLIYDSSIQNFILTLNTRCVPKIFNIYRFYWELSKKTKINLQSESNSIDFAIITEN